MDDEQYLQHALALFTEFARNLRERTGDLTDDHPLRGLSAAFDAAAQAGQGDLYAEGPGLVSRLFTTYPEFAPTFPRELLFFLGGDCLHFMPDEEIAVYQQLDEQRTRAAARGEVLDLQSARANLLKLQ